MKFGTGVWAIEVDPGEMELAIVNLCVNARDAMPDGGVITIAVENVHVMGDDAGDFVKISVADNGVGMAPEVQARAFEPFFTTKDVNKGSGLGLPQVYGFAQQSRGRVTRARLLSPSRGQPRRRSGRVWPTPATSMSCYRTS
jgi:signal transduction histidine kinase